MVVVWNPTGTEPHNAHLADLHLCKGAAVWNSAPAWPPNRPDATDYRHLDVPAFVWQPNLLAYGAGHRLGLMTV